MKHNKSLNDKKNLTPLEHDIFLYIKEASKESPVSRERLSLDLWGDKKALVNVSVAIGKLRNKTKHLGQVMIRRGFGYYFVRNRNIENETIIEDYAHRVHYIHRFKFISDCIFENSKKCIPINKSLISELRDILEKIEVKTVD